MNLLYKIFILAYEQEEWAKLWPQRKREFFLMAMQNSENALVFVDNVFLWCFIKTLIYHPKHAWICSENNGRRL
uniref:Uncharacterized protein n=1 Tax=Meloidogyne enterolobii TaxID=390850 RepID=A0A6V7UTM8_MELEN|nr:unnamed protein product [Meloidogyne enterolobii]